jgi:hypothetical protein
MYCKTISPSVRCGGRKRLPRTYIIRDVIFQIIEDRSALHYCCVSGQFAYLAFCLVDWLTK